MPADDGFRQITDKRLTQLTDTDSGDSEIVVTPSDKRRDFPVSRSTLNGNGGHAFVFHEITAEREYRQHVENQQDNPETLSQLLRHNVRNDFQLITAYADFLASKCGTEDEQRYIHMTNESADHAIELTQMPRDLSEVMISDSVEQQQRNFQTMLTDEVAKIQASDPGTALEFGTAIPSVTLAVSDMISSVFRNRLNHAIRHSNKSGRGGCLSNRSRRDSHSC